MRKMAEIGTSIRAQSKRSELKKSETQTEDDIAATLHRTARPFDERLPRFFAIEKLLIFSLPYRKITISEKEVQRQLFSYQSEIRIMRHKIFFWGGSHCHFKDEHDKTC